MDPPPPNKKRSFSKFLSEQWNKGFRRPPSRLPSPSASQAPSPRSLSPSPLLDDQTSLLSRAGSSLGNEDQSVPRTSTQAPAPLPATGASYPALGDSENGPPIATIVVSSPATDSSNMNESLTHSTTPATVSVHPTGHQATSKVWAGLVTRLQALNISKRMPLPLQSAIGAFIPCLDILEEVAKNRHEYEELASELKCVIDLLAQHGEQSSSTRMSHSIASIAHSIEEQAKLIESKRCRGRGRRLMEANVDIEELERHYRRIRSLFRQLQADANLSIWSIVNDQMANTRLEGLMPVKLANYDSTLLGGVSRRTCTANTRTAMLSDLNDWSNNPNAPDLYWMNGMAGTGKTTIACSFSESLEEHKQLAASFFCTRTVPECRVATRIIPTIAYQLARYSVPFRSALCEALDQDPDAGSKNMMKQFERLLRAPLLQVKDAIPDDLVVVIDALDECDDMRAVELLLSILLKYVADIPLKFFVTSRPEPEIYNRMLTRIQGARATLHLHEVEKSLVQADIEVYLAEELEFMSPTPAQIAELARRSGNLFIYAATLVRYIRPGRRSINPYARLQSALAMTKQPSTIHAEIDELYTAVLRAALDTEGLEDWEVEDVRLVLWTAVCVQEPVDIDTVAALTRLNDARVVAALEALRSVIHFSETSRRVSTLHASFPDFMFDETRSKAFTCNLTQHSELLTRRCFELMSAKLRFNICKLESSFIPDSEVANLDERVEQAISLPLWYACRYWGDHLRQSPYSDSLCAMLNDFLSVRLLFWMEVLNLKRGIRIGAEILLKARVWVEVSVASADLIRLAEDARNFVTSFSANPVSQSTPHIYVSSLAFCPKSSSVFAQYWKKMQGVIDVAGSLMEKRGAGPLASWKTESKIHSVAHSLDGSYVAIGGDGSFHVRSVHDGTLLAGPFEGCTGTVWSLAYSPDGTRIASGFGFRGSYSIQIRSGRDGALVANSFDHERHTDVIWSLAYSPDGTRIVSGSGDKTIRVWSTHDGTLIAGPFEGHTDSVWSVAYSPDGTRIASGSYDKTIRVWDAATGAPIDGPFKEHTDRVLSVAYSPDGMYIASSSRDGTIRVWGAHDCALVVDVATPVLSIAYSSDNARIVSGSADKIIRVWSAYDGTLVGGPFEGHTDIIMSVTFSPDGTSIISSSRDNTIRVWSAHNVARAVGSFEGHTDAIWSVAYSPDGARIASGSYDKTIRVWCAHNGTLVAGPFKGHTHYIQSVAYSPDGSRIVSGSRDRTIRVWDARSGALITGPLEGHTDSVFSVTYSPDGTHIASSSDDRTIRVWNAHDGAPIAGPFRGHTGTVWSVVYSPDGRYIISGSSDTTIRVWSADTGALVTGPFQGHTNSVYSVACSPDSTHVISGSRDGTIRVWSAHDGTLVAGPFKEGGEVWSVAYSPDGTCIVSGSSGAIQVWNVRDGRLIAGPFKPGSWVHSVAYSPDGTYIVSGCHDGTIRIWSNHNGTLIAGPSGGGTNVINDPLSEPSYDLAHRTVRPDGWVVVGDSKFLFWMPFELASCLPPIHNLRVIHANYSLYIDYYDAFFGEHWHHCYNPE